MSTFKRFGAAVIATAALMSFFTVPANAAGHVHHLHVTCSGVTITAPGKYVVTNSVSGCSNNVIQIVSSHVVLDLGRHTIGGDGANRAAGITGPTDFSLISNVVVKNGTVRGFAAGIAFLSVYEAVIEKITTREASSVGMFIAGANDIVRHSRAIDDDTGIATGYGGQIIDNRVTRGSVGIAFVSGANTIQGNVIRDTSGPGIQFCPGTSSCTGELGGNQIIGNTILDAGLDGITIYPDGVNVVISENNVTGSTWDGMHIGTGNLVVGNATNANNDDGIEVTDADDSTVIGDNDANNNGNLGIRAATGVRTTDIPNRASGNADAAECIPSAICV